MTSIPEKPIKLNNAPGGWVINYFDAASTFFEEGDYYRAIAMIEPVISRMRENGTDIPASFLTLYYPLPKNYLKAVINNLPASIRALPLDSQVKFVLYFFSLIKQESNFDQNDESPAGALGLCQLMPGTARDMAKQLGLDHNKININDPEQNIKLAVYYFGWLVNKYDLSHISACLAAYNAGHGRISGMLKREGIFLDNLENIPESAQYVKVVKENYRYYADLYRTEVRAALQPVAVAAARPELPVSAAQPSGPGIISTAVSYIRDFVSSAAVASQIEEAPQVKYVSAETLMGQAIPARKAPKAGKKAVAPRSKWHLVIAGYASTKGEAKKIQAQLLRVGIGDCCVVPEPENGRFRVQAGAFADHNNAVDRHKQVKRIFADAMLFEPNP
ncbi:MAG: transglycosylase SLT domain-containing protein [Candidatus Margulisbacteria bacterium]|nr:transglycosylase SLT domain-containing protein [Candidatus Margulisiibacteriota bacterium]